ncbi:MAG: hypothetical protein ABW199_04565, partial [Caulobacterales bacterium]
RSRWIRVEMRARGSYPCAMPSALFLRHSPYVNPDLAGEWLTARGYDLRVIDPPKGELDHNAIQNADVLVILGGAMGVYEEEKHPWITPEVAAIRTRLEAGKPALGLCLGAQMMAAALGAKVYKGAAGNEIGWPKIFLTPEGQQSPLRPLDGMGVMQWHGDTFDLPAGAVRLARNGAYENQAFSFGKHGLALQFHLETSPAGLDQWLEDKTDTFEDLKAAGWTKETLRAETAFAAPLVRNAAFETLDNWLDGITGARL